MSRLGDLIRLERNRRGMTVKQVAKKCGVSSKYLQEVESGKRIIADDQARRILRTMGLEQQAEADFTLDDIAVTVDLQTAMPQAQQAVRKAAEKRASTGETEAVEGSIWLDALSSVLKHVPVYNAVMKEVSHRLLPITEGKIEGAPADKVFYFQAPDNRMRGFRIQQGDKVLVVPANAPVDGAIMLIETNMGFELRMVKLMPRFQVMLQRYDQAFESDIHNIADLRFIGRCVRLEADLS
ncbi:MAG: helix-turn-helix transcriptional regulator [Clostridiales bacterium]|jgi:transcriptional regulator with XRE-family HTH domain|nr:helix-turn-helix transcriptional regulator [Clostridiales bacterium]